MRTRVRLASLIVLVALGAPLAASAASAGRRSITPREVVGYGHQQTLPRADLFGLFAVGLGNAAVGSVSYFAWTGVDLSVWTTAQVSCLRVTGHRAVISGVEALPDGTSRIVVIEAVDNSSPSQASNPDELRVSHSPDITQTGTPGCYAPTLPPVAIRSGDIRVEAGG